MVFVTRTRILKKKQHLMYWIYLMRVIYAIHLMSWNYLIDRITRSDVM